MRIKKIITKYTTILSFILVLITGCGNQNKTKNLNGVLFTNIFHIIKASDFNTTGKLELIKNSTSSLMDDYVKPEDRLKIDFSFPNSLQENYSLSLLPINGKKEEYKLVVYDSDTIIQECFCGKISGTPEFSFDDVYSGRDLEMFYYDEDINEWTGLLFIWDYQNDKIKENFIRIPKYDKIVKTNRIGILSVIDDNDSVFENTIYEVSDDLEYAVEIRKWVYEKDTRSLNIFDLLENKIIFEGKVTLDKENNIVNEEYYQFLFLYEIPPIRDAEINEEINVTFFDNNLINEETYIYNNLIKQESYSNKQDFLFHYNFHNKEPLYQCYDVLGNLLVELYFDEETKTGCGIRYENFYNSDLEKEARVSGFCFNSIEIGTWTFPESFAIKPYNHKTNDIREMNGIENYEEIMEYTKNGKPDYFESKGIITYIDEEDIETLLSIDFVYKDDGTLIYKDYYHNSFAFGTTNCSMNLYYDELERIKYESDYITHGSIEYYYIYKDNNKKPSYCLSLDDNLGRFVPFFIKYE